MKKGRPVSTMAQLEKLMPEIIKKVNADQDLAIRAASNPLLAVEELGYKLDPELYLITYRRLRHTKATAERLNELAEEIFQYAGKRFDLEDSDELEDVLFKRLKLKQPVSKALGLKSQGGLDPKILRPPVLVRRGEKVEDPLAAAQKIHPIMKPLVEYRRIDAKVPKYAPRELYERIKNGEVKVPIIKIKLRMTREIPKEG